MRALAIMALGLCAAGCLPHLEVKPQKLSGHFAGATEAGEAVVLVFSERQEAFRGEGTLGGEPLVVAGAAGWRGVGSLEAKNGAPELIELLLSADGEALRVLRAGEPPLVLVRQSSPVPASAPGPLSGRWRATSGRAPLAEVTLVERQGLIAGAGIVTGDPVGITGRTVSATELEGTVTFLDGSQAPFKAGLSSDGQTLAIEGFGERVSLKRRSQP